MNIDIIMLEKSRISLWLILLILVRRYNDLNERRENSNEKNVSEEKSLPEKESLEKENQPTGN